MLDDNGNEIFTIENFHNLVRKFDDDYKKRDRNLFGQMAVSKEMIELFKPKNMWQNSVLNNSIFSEISSHLSIKKDQDLSYVSGLREAANAIERLVLQEKIDLLNSLWRTHVQNNKSLGVNFTEKIAELTNQLNNLPL